MIYKVCRIINVVCAVLTSVLFIDLLILPKIEKNEKVVSGEAVYYHMERQRNNFPLCHSVGNRSGGRSLHNT